MKKTIFTVVLSLMAISTVFAQTQVGLRAGLNVATTTNSVEADDLEAPWRPGLVIGLATSFRAGENFAIAPEFNYVQKGSKLEGSYSPIGTAFPFNEEFDVKLNYIELPLLFRAHFGDVLGGYVNAGPTFSYLFSGEFVRDGEDEDFEVEDASFNRFQLGAAIGGGVALNTEIGTFLIDIRYTRDFSKLYDDNQDDRTNTISLANYYDREDARNQMISTSLIFLIPSLR